jgi:hypothetical protein
MVRKYEDSRARLRALDEQAFKPHCVDISRQECLRSPIHDNADDCRHCVRAEWWAAAWLLPACADEGHLWRGGQDLNLDFLAAQGLTRLRGQVGMYLYCPPAACIGESNKELMPSRCFTERLSIEENLPDSDVLL